MSAFNTDLLARFKAEKLVNFLPTGYCQWECPNSGARHAHERAVAGFHPIVATWSHSDQCEVICCTTLIENAHFLLGCESMHQEQITEERAARASLKLEKIGLSDDGKQYFEPKETITI